MYIKVKDRELFKELDDNLTLPDKWKDFINERKIRAKLILKLPKNKNTNYYYYCTNCETTFEHSNIKVDNYCKCPNCKNDYLIKSNRISKYEFRDEMAIFDSYKDYYIVRQFRINTYYRNEKYESYFYEYARVIYDKNLNIIEEIVNENVVGTTAGMFISYRKDVSNDWRYFRSNWSYLPCEFIYYPYNLKEVLSDIPSLKYSQLWELAKHVGYFDLIFLIRKYNPSVELLTKMKLYNLALCPETFKNKKTFDERFMGLTKDFIPFIQEYNLNLDQLKVLSYLKIKNIKYINALEGMSWDALDNLSKKVNLISLINKTDFNYNLLQEYQDYLSMAKKLKIDLKNKSNLYPKNIKEAHDKILKEYKQQKDSLINNSIMKRYKKIKKNEYQKGKYIIIAANNFQSLVDESSQQNNCVRTYAERIANGECDIYFVRLVKDINNSLVTVEVRNNKVVQKRTKNNGITTKSQDNFLKLWEQSVLQQDNM